MHPQRERERERVTMREGEQTNKTHLLVKHKTDHDMIHTPLRPDDTHAKKHVHTAGAETTSLRSRWQRPP